MMPAIRHGALVALLLWVCIASGTAQVFRSQTELVRLDVSVTQGETSVDGLTAADFLVTDNGVEQAVESVSAERTPLRVQIAFDASSSVSGRRLRSLLAAVSRIFDELRPGDRVGVMTFSHRLRIQVPMTEDLAAARAALDRIQPEGQTALRDAVPLSLTLAEGPESRGLVLLFTDGEDNASWISNDGVIEFARRADAILHVITLDSRLTFEANPLVVRLTQATGGREFKASSENDLTRLALAGFGEMRSRYLLTYAPKGPASPGWHEVKVRLRNRGGTVRARPGYVAAR